MRRHFGRGKGPGHLERARLVHFELSRRIIAGEETYENGRDI